VSIDDWLFLSKFVSIFYLKEFFYLKLGNHMISIASVQRKADTIMRQVNTKGNAINMNDFIIVSKKFPNILLPSLGVLGK
jgi:TFIIF-interacting CTD phosphatase-like protein